jgi:hypothetical protein
MDHRSSRTLLDSMCVCIWSIWSQKHCFCNLGSHFEALKSVLLIFFLVYASKKYDQTDSCAPQCLPSGHKNSDVYKGLQLK